MKYCAVYGCNSKSTDHAVSFFSFPRNHLMRKTWAFKTRRKNFTPTNNSSICSLHFLPSDYVQHRTKKYLNAGAVPSVFNWTSDQKKRKLPRERNVLGEIHAVCGTLQHSLTSTSSQTEACTLGQFSVEALMHSTPKDLVKFYTGFNTIEQFFRVLDFILPDKDRKHIRYYNTRFKDQFCSTANIFDSDEEFDAIENETEASTVKKVFAHKLSVENEFLLVMVRLRLGLFYGDLGMRFGISAATVHRIFYSWINYMYLRLGAIKCFPHRDTIISAMKEDFKREYPTTMAILDCTEIKLEMPSSLVQQSRTFSSYKSTNTLKGLIGVDSLGGIMFVSQLYGGSISDKEICSRSGFFELVAQKIKCGELLNGDAIMADKGFNITTEVKNCGLELNIPPFLPTGGRFTADDVIATKTIAKHRIHVERAIRKIRRFHIFDRKIPISMLEIINQIWLVCCMLSNFQDPIIC